MLCLSFGLCERWVNFNKQWASMGLPWWLRWSRFCLQCKWPEFDPWVGKIPWRREWIPILVFLPGEVHEQRSLLGYSPWSHKESDMTGQLTQACMLYLLCTRYCARNRDLPRMNNKFLPSRGHIGKASETNNKNARLWPMSEGKERHLFIYMVPGKP